MKHVSRIHNHFGLSHFFFERTKSFPVHELSGFALSKCLQPKFVVMARVIDGTNVPISPVPASTLNMGSLDGSLPDFQGPRLFA